MTIYDNLFLINEDGRSTTSKPPRDFGSVRPYHGAETNVQTFWHVGRRHIGRGKATLMARTRQFNMC